MTDSILRSYQYYTTTTLIPYPVPVIPPDFASDFLDGETDGFAFDATTYDEATSAAYVGGPVGGTVAVIHVGDPTDDLDDVPLNASNLTNAGTSPKMVHHAESPYVRWSPHNIALQSQTFGTTWTQTSVSITSNSTTAPDGTSTADTMTATSTAGCLVTQDVSGKIDDTTHTSSVYAKAGTASWIVVVDNYISTGGAGAWFELAGAGAVGTVQAGVTTTSIQSVGSGWYRCSITGTNSSATNQGFAVIIVDADASTSVTNGRTVYLWGAQVNRGSIATPYVATISAIGVGIALHYDAASEQYAVLTEQAITTKHFSSEDMTTTWGVLDGGCSINANAVTAPDGTTTADTLVESGAGAGNVRHGITQLQAGEGFLQTLSVYVKPGTATWGYISVAWSADAYGVVFSLADGSLTDTFTNGTPGNTSFRAVSVGDGWLRVSVGGNSTGNADCRTLICLSNSATPSYSGGGCPTYVGGGTNTMHVWGTQLESTLYPTSYVPTRSAPVTRAVDQVSCAATSIPSFTTELGQWVWAKTPDVTTGNSTAGGSVSNEVTSLYTSGGNAKLYAEDGGTPQADFTIGAVTAATAFKVAGRWKANDFHAALNGTLSGAPDTTGTMPAPTTFRFGYSASTAAAAQLLTYRYVMVPRAYTNVELQAKST